MLSACRALLARCSAPRRVHKSTLFIWNERRRNAKFYSSDQDLLERKVNLGATIDVLTESIPHMLRHPIPNSITHNNIRLELLPESYAIDVRGYRAYYASVKLIGLMATTLLVPRDTQLFILSKTVIPGQLPEDTKFFVTWRSVIPNRVEKAESWTDNLTPGRIIQTLRLMPDEYPLLAGSFEFRFNSAGDKVLLHIVRNVEYLARPAPRLDGAVLP